MALLHISDLRTHFRTDDGLVRAVDGVDLSLEPGETLGIVGESGSGKSVLSLSVMQLIPTPPGSFPSGRILLGGEDLMGMGEEQLRRLRGNKVSMIFQDPMTSLNPYLRVSRQLTEVLENHRRMGARAARHEAVEMLARVGISDPDRRIDSYPHEFSGGMRQRVMIAMALLCRPELLIADEPTTALDVTIQAQILELIAELQRDLGTAVILITHDLGVVAGTADRVAVIYAGRIVEQGTTREIFEDPRHPYTRGLLASVPRLDRVHGAALVPIPGLPPDLSNLPPGCPFAPRCAQVTEPCKARYPDTVPLGEGRFAKCWEVSP